MVSPYGVLVIVGVGVKVSEAVTVGVGVKVGVAVGVSVIVGVTVTVGVAVLVGLGVVVFVGVGVFVLVGVGDFVGDAVTVGVAVGAVEVTVGVGDAVAVGVAVGAVEVTVGVATVKTKGPQHLLGILANADPLHQSVAKKNKNTSPTKVFFTIHFPFRQAHQSSQGAQYRPTKPGCGQENCQQYIEQDRQCFRKSDLETGFLFRADFG